LSWYSKLVFTVVVWNEKKILFEICKKITVGKECVREKNDRISSVIRKNGFTKILKNANEIKIDNLVIQGLPLNEITFLQTQTDDINRIIKNCT
jgi:dissimilatory sulfite reductase (desulfoviridin) alpha/beta subunit